MIGMGMEAGVVSAIGGVVVMVLGVLVRLLKLESTKTDALAAKHQDCMEQHAENRERIGVLTATVQTLAQRHEPDVQRQIESMISEVEAKIESKKVAAA